MMYTQKKHLAFAVAGAVSLAATIAHAEDFTASATLQNTLAVTNIQDFDLGSVFATVTGTLANEGVGALNISALGVVTDPTDSTTINLTSLGAPTAAQGSVDMAAEFTLTLPATDAIDAADFAADASGTLAADMAANGIELVHETGNPSVPSLWLMHFTLADVSGGAVGTEATPFDGVFTVTPDFGDTTYVFNIGATVTTEPGALDGTAAYPATYQEGVYSGTFAVTAAY